MLFPFPFLLSPFPFLLFPFPFLLFPFPFLLFPFPFSLLPAFPFYLLSTLFISSKGISKIGIEYQF
ncbi:MAG: hypothetical protein EOM53_05830 [Alphaproteobacteria bacterium]|nr:hypothetical protein [Alphaproteobacteria bacterium]